MARGVPNRIWRVVDHYVGDAVERMACSTVTRRNAALAEAYRIPESLSAADLRSAKGFLKVWLAVASDPGSGGAG
jgi:hypothetical protein